MALFFNTHFFSTGTRFGPWRARGPKCCDSRRVNNQCNALLDFPRLGLGDRCLRLLNPLFLLYSLHEESLHPAWSQAKQWRLRPDISLLTTILVFRSWQQDVRVENGQGTDAKTMLTLIDVSSRHSQGSLPFWSRLVKHAYNYGIVLGTMILFQTIAKTSNRKLERFCQRFDMRFRTSNMAPFCKSLHLHISEKFHKGTACGMSPAH